MSRDALSERIEIARTLVRSGVLKPERPDRTVKALSALRRWGPTLAGGYSAAAARSPDAVAVLDESRSVTFRELDERATRLAHGLASLGVGPGTRVAVMARNHALLIETLVAVGRLGADAVLVNTGLSAAQATAVVTGHETATLVADEEFTTTLAGVPAAVPRVTAWSDGNPPGPTVEDLIAAAPATPLRPPAKAGRVIVLTSGTTGVPKGARRPNPRGLSSAAAILSRIPLAAGERIAVPAPMFHTWGFAALQLAMSLRATLVLDRRFDPEGTLATVERHRATALFAVPVMLQRIMELPEEARKRYDTSSLRIVASSGSALPAACVTGFLDAFGDVLYNLYGSTEVSWASIAAPAELRAAPSTAGRRPLGTRVAIVDDEGRPVPQGEVGRIFVGNDMLFDGYTGGAGSKEVLGGLMSTGDRGYLDPSGLLFVSGRDDDMIISGGENLYPREVEDVIAALPGVAEVAVAGVPDERFGQRFAAYVVPFPDAELTEDKVREHVRQHLSRYSVPRDVVFATSLPRNATGKVVLKALRDLGP